MSPTSMATWFMPTILGLCIATSPAWGLAHSDGALASLHQRSRTLARSVAIMRVFARPLEETIMSAAFDLTSRLAKGLPDPAPRFPGFPKYNFVGGHNDPERIPIEGLIEATASVLRRDGGRLAMYNLGQGPQGYPGLRETVADKLNRHRGMKITRDEVLVTTGSGQGIDIVSRMFINKGDTVI